MTHKFYLSLVQEKQKHVPRKRLVQEYSSQLHLFLSQDLLVLPRLVSKSRDPLTAGFHVAWAAGVPPCSTTLLWSCVLLWVFFFVPFLRTANQAHAESMLGKQVLYHSATCSFNS